MEKLFPLRGINWLAPGLDGWRIYRWTTRTTLYARTVVKPEEVKDLSAYLKQVPANKGMSQDGVFCMENGVFCITPLTMEG